MAVTSPETDAPNEFGWQAQQLRLTVFPESSGTSERTDWWAEVIGEPPEERQEHQREQRWRDAGTLPNNEDVAIVLAVQRDRIDWVLQPSDARQGEAMSLAKIGAPDEVMDNAFELLSTWLTNFSPAASRVAVGLTAMWPGETLEECNRVASLQLPFDVDPQTRDLSVRANLRRPRSNGPAGGMINRVATWAVRAVLDVDVSVNAGENPSSSVSVTDAFYVMQAQFDINTIPGELTPPVAGADLLAVTEELADEARHMLATGYTGMTDAE